MSRSERERLVDEEAVRKALAAAGKAPESAPVVVASAAIPSAPAASASATTGAEHEVLFQQAQALEQSGKSAEKSFGQIAIETHWGR